MKNLDENPYVAYLSLMRWKKFLVFSPFLLMTIAANLVGFLNLSFSVAIVILAIYLYIMMMIFLAKNNCPWCHEPFFAMGIAGIQGTGLNFILQQHCQNCGSPHASGTKTNF